MVGTGPIAENVGTLSVTAEIRVVSQAIIPTFAGIQGRRNGFQKVMSCINEKIS